MKAIVLFYIIGNFYLISVSFLSIEAIICWRNFT